MKLIAAAKEISGWGIAAAHVYGKGVPPTAYCVTGWQCERREIEHRLSVYKGGESVPVPALLAPAPLHDAARSDGQSAAGVAGAIRHEVRQIAARAVKLSYK